MKSRMLTRFALATVVALPSSAFAAKTCEGLFEPSDRMYRDFTKGPLVGEAGANYWYQQILKASKAPQPKRAQIEVESFEEMMKSLGGVTKFEQNISRAVEIQTAPVLHKLAPHLFERDFQPHLDGRLKEHPDRWARLKDSDLVIRHFGEFLDLMLVRESNFSGSENPADRGSHLIELSQSKLKEILIEKLDAVTAERMSELVDIAYSKIQENAADPVRVENLAQGLNGLLSSELLTFQLLEIRRDYLSRLTKEEIAREPHRIYLTGHIFAMSRDVIYFSTAFQDYLLQNPPTNVAWLRLLSSSQFPLKDAVDKLMLERLASSRITERGYDLWSKLAMTDYFLRTGQHRKETLEFLLRVQKQPNLFPSIVEKVEENITRALP